MYEIGTLGRWEHIPEEAAAVYEADPQKLRDRPHQLLSAHRDQPL